VHFSVGAVLPNSNWNVDAGSYVEFWVYSAEDGCGTPLCSNNISSTNPSGCGFTHKSAKADFFVFVKAPLTGQAGQLFTLLIDVASANTMPPPVPKKVQNSCPTEYENLLASLRMGDVPLVVENTSDDTDSFLQIELPVCDRYDNGFTYTAQIVDTGSAISSFLCHSTPCNAAPDRAFASDVTGSAMNQIQVSSPVTESVYLGVSGFGVFEKISEFVFTVVPQGS